MEEDELQGQKIRKKQKTQESFSETLNLVDDINKVSTFQPRVETIIMEQPVNFQARIENAPGFYSSKKEISKTERDAYLATSDLRNFHNWIKSVLIKKYSENVKQVLKEKQIHGKISVMEVGCGQGGDLLKWAHAGIGSFIGLDIANLEKTKKRYSDLCKNTRFRDIYKAKFLVQSGESPQSEFYSNINQNLFFDIISCQFSLHYMFGSKQSAQNLFTNLTSKLVDQGLIICTIPDSNVIVKRFRNQGKRLNDGDFVVGNKYYSMKINDLNFPPDKIYGLKYLFYLEDAVGSKIQLSDEDPTITYVPEYLIEFQNFVRVAKEFNLEVVEEKNFLDFYKDNRTNFKHLFPILKLKYGLHEHMDPQLWEISHLYKVVVLRKKCGVSSEKIQRRFNDLQQGYYEVEAEEKFK